MFTAIACTPTPARSNARQRASKRRAARHAARKRAAALTASLPRPADAAAWRALARGADGRWRATGRAPVRHVVGARALAEHGRAAPADVGADRFARQRRPAGRPSCRHAADGSRGRWQAPEWAAWRAMLAGSGGAGAGAVLAAGRWALARGADAGRPADWRAAMAAAGADVDASGSAAVGRAMLAHRAAERAASIAGRAAMLAADVLPAREQWPRPAEPTGAAPVRRRKRT